MTRRQQLWALIGLSALTAAVQYVIQGALATGADLATFPPLFWVADYSLWGVRALIEAWVIVYLFQTTGGTARQQVVITAFEVVLIGLIAVTLGPALRAVGLGEPVKSTMSATLFGLWNLGIAAYTSLMMGAAGYAYRVQPLDSDSGATEYRCPVAGCGKTFSSRAALNGHMSWHKRHGSGS